MLPIPRAHIEKYRAVAVKVAEIWIEHGALAYTENISDGIHMKGTRSFEECIGIAEDEVAIFGWATFESREARDQANKRVFSDQRMQELVAPLMDPVDPVFNPQRMVYGGFQPLVYADSES